MKKKLLFVVDNLVMGGVTKVLSNLLNHLDYDKYQVDLLVLHYGEDISTVLPEQVGLIKGDSTYKYIDKSIGSILANKDIKALLGKLSLVFALKSGAIKARIRRSRARILPKDYDTEIAFNDGFSQIFVAQGKSKRKIAWMHTDVSVFNDSARYVGLISESLKKMDAFACVSSQVKSAYEQLYGIENATVIHNIMDAPKILRDAELPPDFLFDKTKINLLSVGRLCEAKNFLRFIRIHSMLMQQGYPIHSYIIGEGEDRPLLEKEIAALGVGESFSLLGRKDNPFPYVKQADAFILSSDHEGLPTVLFEALILGIPCVSTNVGGAGEILKDGKYGIISDVDDVALCEAIKEMLYDDNLAAYRNAVKNYDYSVSSIISQIEELL